MHLPYSAEFTAISFRMGFRQIWDDDHRCRMRKRHANPAKETAVKHKRIVKESSRLFRDRLWAK